MCIYDIDHLLRQKHVFGRFSAISSYLVAIPLDVSMIKTRHNGLSNVPVLIFSYSIMNLMFHLKA